jgi:DNA-directed RNA polymerase subunit RPC12/RpoP
MSLIARLSGHKCPKCDAQPGWFALHSTFKGGVKRKQYNDFVACPGCDSRLVLVARPNGPNLLLWQIFLPVVLAVVFLAGIRATLTFVPPQMGLTLAVAALFSFSACFAIVITLVKARLERHFFQVEAL